VRLLLRQNLALHRPLRGPGFPCALRRPYWVILHSDRLLLLHRERPALPAQRGLLARLCRHRDIQRERAHRRRVDSLVRARRRVIVRQRHRDKFVLVDRRVPAALLEDIRRVRAAVANGADVPGSKDPSADSAPEQLVVPESRKRNRASHSMRASRPPRAAARSSRSVMRKASASCIPFARARAWAQVVQHRLSLSRRYSANRVK
jgi:hypothetical protein